MKLEAVQGKGSLAPGEQSAEQGPFCALSVNPTMLDIPYSPFETTTTASLTPTNHYNIVDTISERCYILGPKH